MNGHAVALWAGIVSFFGGLLAIGAIDIFSLSGVAEFAASIIVALVTAGGVYSQQRFSDAKRVEEAKRIKAAASIQTDLATKAQAEMEGNGGD